MVIIQFAYAVVNILYKITANQDMNLRVLIAYRYVFAAAFTCPLAFIVQRLENLAMRSQSRKAKVVGTLIGIGGAMILTLYKGVNIKGSSAHVDATHVGLLGSLMALASCVSYAAWFIVQAKMSEKYPSQYWSTSKFAAVQSVLFALCMERDLNHWKLGWDVRLLTAAYSGIVILGVMVIFMAWCVRKRGPLFVSIFNPLLLVLVALAGSLILDEKLYLGRSGSNCSWIIRGIMGKSEAVREEQFEAHGQEIAQSSVRNANFKGVRENYKRKEYYYGAHFNFW